MRKLFFPFFILLGATVMFTGYKKADISKQPNTSSITSYAPTKWTIDKVHSNVKFTVTHLVISEVEGYFKIFEGSM